MDRAEGLGAHPSPYGERLAVLPPGGSWRRKAPAAAQTKCVCRARSRAWLGAAAPPPRAQAALQSRPLGSARPSSPRRRLRLRRARPRLTLPPQLRQLRLGAGWSRSPDPEPGKRRRRARRAVAAAAEAGVGGAAEAPGRAPWPLLPKPGRLARRRRAPGARAARRVLRASRRELRPGRGRGQNGRSPSSGRRQEAPCPGAGGYSPAHRAQQTSPPPRCRRGRGRGGLRAGPRDPQSLLAAWVPGRGRARAQRPPGGTESSRIERRGSGADRGGSAPADAACKVREKKTSAPGRFGPRCTPRPPKPASLKEAPRPRRPPRSAAPDWPPGPGAGNDGDCVRLDDPTRGRGAGGGRATWPREEVS